MLELMKSAAVSTLVSACISGLGVFYLQRYLESRRRQSEEASARRRAQRRKADLLESRRRRAAGRLLFWQHDAIVKGVEHANGDLARAFEDYNLVEEEQKAFEQEMLAEHQDENRMM